MDKDLEQMYQEKINRLEQDIDSLRMSRRIMMTLLEQNQTSQKARIEQLLSENRRLNRRASAYARQLWQMRMETAGARLPQQLKD